MAITFSNKTALPSQIDCDGVTQVTLAFLVEPDPQPTDIVLLLDRSCVMSGTPLETIQTDASALVHQLAGGGTTIRTGSRVGVVGFSATATVDAPLTDSVAALDAAIDSQIACATANYADGFNLAIAQFDPLSSARKIIILFADGLVTAGGSPRAITTAAKADDIEIYCVGVAGSSGLDGDTLATWASTPTDDFVVLSPDSAQMTAFFAGLADSLLLPGATNVVIHETVNPAFTITGLTPPGQGTASITDPQTILWTIPTLAATESEGAALQFTVQHTAGTPGIKDVNQSVTYQDDQGHLVDFPNPTVTVSCDTPDVPDPCPTPFEFTIDGCTDAITVDAGTVALTSEGRIVQLSLTLQNVCPGRRVALAVALSETTCGTAEPRGLKTFVIPAHQQTGCQDVTVSCIKFILPDALAPCAGSCQPRTLQAQCLAHYIDTDFVCCDGSTASAACGCALR